MTNRSTLVTLLGCTRVCVRVSVGASVCMCVYVSVYVVCMCGCVYGSVYVCAYVCACVCMLVCARVRGVACVWGVAQVAPAPFGPGHEYTEDVPRRYPTSMSTYYHGAPVTTAHREDGVMGEV